MSALVGILNLTPDSFSDGGEFASSRDALMRIEHMLQQGVAVIDIGAESTRPGAVPLSSEEEWRRLEPVLPSAVRRFQVIFSIDTRHAETANKALQAGATWINDVSGGAESECWKVVKNYPAAKYVLMHSLTVPANKNITLAQHVDPVEEVLAFFVSRMAAIDLPRDQIILDPGIGFGKTAEQSMQLIRRAAELKVLGLPVMIGHSRKSCFSSFAETAAERDGATLAASLYLEKQGVDYLRVHNVGLHRQAMAMEKVLRV